MRLSYPVTKPQTTMQTNSRFNNAQLALFGIPVLALLAVGCNKNDVKPDTRLNAKLDAIRQAGYPITLAECNAWYVEPPAVENAALLYADAFAALSPVEPTSPTFLAENQRALDLLHQAGSRNKCRYPIDMTKGAFTLLPHLQAIKKGAQLLSQAALNHATKGEIGLSAQSLLDGLHLARSLEEEPMFISHLVQVASEAIIQTGLESVLNQKAFTDEQLVRLQAAFRDAESGAVMTRSLAGERCLGIALFQMPPLEQAKVFAQIDGEIKTLDTQAYQKSYTYKVDFDFFLSHMDEYIAATTLPYPKGLEVTTEWAAQVSETKSKGYHISGSILPTLESSLERAAECAGRLRVAQTALAVERYRLAHQNALPDSLGELAPRFVDPVPVDPFDGQPLRYTKTSPQGFVIYSIGKDRKDSGGTPRPTGAKSDALYDLTFVVRR
jgi:hypothetical protein